MSSIKLALAGLCISSIAAADTGITLSADVAYWHPRADANAVAETSPAVRPEVAYAFRPWLAAFASFDWVVVDKANDLRAGGAYYYAASLGGRITMPMPGRVQPVLAASLGRYSVHADCVPSVCGGALVHDNALGGRVDAGVTVALWPSVHARASLGYSHARMEMGSLDALIVDVGLGVSL